MRSFLFAALLVAAPAHAQDLTPAETRRIDTVVTETLAKTGVPSASIAVVRGGRIVLTKAYGKASETIPVARADLPYQIASISKQFTAAAVLLLEDEGKLSLADPVSKYVPGIPDGDRITVRQLLDHTSGIRDYWPHDYSPPAMARPITPQQIVDRWAKAPLDFAPGTQWQYSNTAYVVAGMIVEKVSGEPLFAFLQRRIFRPLGMTSVVDQDKANGAGFPQPYKRAALGPVRVETPPAPGWLFAAGELAMSARDLARWDVARMTRDFLPADDWQAQETVTKLNDGKDTGYGLGVFVGEGNGRRFVEHGGEAVGFLSENIVFPAEKAAVVVLTNSWFSDATQRIAQGITAAILPPPPALAAEAGNTARARALFDQLRGGTLDASKLTANAASYFDAQARADYRESLSPLGEPERFEPVGRPRPRGGFVGRSYRIVYPGGRTLSLSTFTEPGENGRFEQYLIGPAQ